MPEAGPEADQGLVRHARIPGQRLGVVAKALGRSWEVKGGQLKKNKSRTELFVNLWGLVQILEISTVASFPKIVSKYF